MKRGDAPAGGFGLGVGSHEPPDRTRHPSANNHTTLIKDWLGVKLEREMKNEIKKDMSVFISELQDVINSEYPFLSVTVKLPSPEGKDTNTLIEEFFDPETPEDVIKENLEQIRSRVEILRKIMDE